MKSRGTDRQTKSISGMLTTLKDPSNDIVMTSTPIKAENYLATRTTMYLPRYTREEA